MRRSDVEEARRALNEYAKAHGWRIERMSRYTAASRGNDTVKAHGWVGDAEVKLLERLKKFERRISGNEHAEIKRLINDFLTVEGIPVEVEHIFMTWKDPAVGAQ